jgi:hypothetical protein
MGQIDRIVNTDDELRVAQARLADRGGEGRVVVVGARTTNLQPGARNHPRVDVWESTELKNGSAPLLPSSTAVVICTRFCSHRMTDGLRKQAQDRRAFMFGGLKQTGEIRSILGKLLHLDEVPERVVEMAVLAGMPERVEQAVSAANERLGMDVRTREFVEYDPDERGGPVTQSIVRSMERRAEPEGGDAVENRLDDAIKMVAEAVTALVLVKEELERTRGEVAAARKDIEIVKKFKALLGSV